MSGSHTRGPSTGAFVFSNGLEPSPIATAPEHSSLTAGQSGELAQSGSRQSVSPSPSSSSPFAQSPSIASIVRTPSPTVPFQPPTWMRSGWPARTGTTTSEWKPKVPQPSSSQASAGEEGMGQPTPPSWTTRTVSSRRPTDSQVRIERTPSAGGVCRNQRSPVRSGSQAAGRLEEAPVLSKGCDPAATTVAVEQVSPPSWAGADEAARRRRAGPRRARGGRARSERKSSVILDSGGSSPVESAPVESAPVESGPTHCAASQRGGAPYLSPGSSARS